MRKGSGLGVGIIAIIALFAYSQAGASTNDVEAGEAAFDAPPVDDLTGGYRMLGITQLSDAGLQALKDREGFSATPYPDHKGYSIGYGHLIKRGETLDHVTQDQALALLADDVQWASNAVTRNVTVALTQNEYDALVSFVFNLGEPNFKRSTLLAKLNAGDPTVSEEFAKWVYASGVINTALVARRQSEVNQFLA